MAELEEYRLIGQRRCDTRETGKAPDAFYLVQRVFHPPVREIEPLLHEVNSQHRAATPSVVVCVVLTWGRVVQASPATQPMGWPVPSRLKNFLPGAAFLVAVFQFGKSRLS